MSESSLLAVISTRECSPRLEYPDTSNPLWEFPCGLVIADIMLDHHISYVAKQIMGAVHQAHHSNNHPSDPWGFTSTMSSSDIGYTESFACHCKEAP